MRKHLKERPLPLWQTCAPPWTFFHDTYSSIPQWTSNSNAVLVFPFSAGWESLNDTSLLGELDCMFQDSLGSPFGQYAQMCYHDKPE